jgi:hypothetical protein
VSPGVAGCQCRSVGASAWRASVACPSLGETGLSSMTIVADFRAGKGTVGGAYWRDALARNFYNCGGHNDYAVGIFCAPTAS